MEIKPVKNEETGEVEWLLLVGGLKFHCASHKEAKYLEMQLEQEKNREIMLLLMQQWDDDILKALKKQHLIFKAMILNLLGWEVRIWSEDMAAQMIWQAVDFCQYWHQQMSQARQPAWHAKLKNNDEPCG